MNATSVSYVGTKVFIGIDVHKATYSISCVVDGVLVKRCTIKAQPQGLVHFIKKYFPGVEVETAYEASFCGFVLHRYLEAHGIANKVVHAGSIEIAARDTVKTDKRDSLKIAVQLAAGRLRGIYMPSEAMEARRLLTRTREQLVANRQRLMNQIRMKLHQFGLIAADEKGVLSTLKVRRALEKPTSNELKICVGSLLTLWKGMSTEIQNLNQSLTLQASLDNFESTYRSMPGVGLLTARILSNELGDMSQFANERALFSYTGLTPREFSTGEKRRLGHISRQGSSRLRAVLVEAAWRAIKEDPSLKNDFERLAIKAGKKRAIVAIARKFIGRARALFRNKTYYVCPIDWRKAA